MKLYTIKKKIDNYTIKATQEYHEKYDSGHYRAVVEDAGGDIIYVYQTCCSPPTGKIDEATLRMILKQLKRWR